MGTTVGRGGRDAAMTERVVGKVVLITGAARGQGRSHAILLAREGADIIAVDYCTSFDTISYPMATPADLAQTAKEVEALDRRVLTVQAEVPEPNAIQPKGAPGNGQLGRADVVLAQTRRSALAVAQPLHALVSVSRLGV